VENIHAKVKLKNPNVELFIEIRDELAYFCLEKIKGPGGLPMGSQGRILSLIQTYNSILASWYMMRRGCNIYFVNFNNKINNVLNKFIKNWYAKNDIKNIKINSDDLYKDLSNLITENKCDAVVTGNSIFVDEQLLDISKLKTNIQVPILFPLISMKENEINIEINKIELFK
jgi:thiamine biosynthesis protein ThiI